MAIEDDVVEKVNDLVAEAHSLSRGNEYDQVRSEAHLQECQGWIASALNVVQLIVPDPSGAYRKLAERIAGREAGCGINGHVGEFSHLLQNLLKDIHKGLISSIADRARAEVFDDFLDHARSYLKDGRKNESGVIGGVVFEDSLRRVCRKQGIQEGGVKLDQLISDLTSKGILSPTKAKRARAAAHVRTKATHAQWDEFDIADVRAAIKFTEELILNYVED